MQSSHLSAMYMTSCLAPGPLHPFNANTHHLIWKYPVWPHTHCLSTWIHMLDVLFVFETQSSSSLLMSSDNPVGPVKGVTVRRLNEG